MTISKTYYFAVSRKIFLSSFPSFSNLVIYWSSGTMKKAIMATTKNSLNLVGKAAAFISPETRCYVGMTKDYSLCIRWFHVFPQNGRFQFIICKPKINEIKTDSFLKNTRSIILHLSKAKNVEWGLSEACEQKHLQSFILLQVSKRAISVPHFSTC